MSTVVSHEERIRGALMGMFIGDALSMPVHWYYNTGALVRDYGRVSSYVAPKNPHPDSILWRSSYTPINEKGNILHSQSRYWGKKGIHYHQFLQAGENTLNLKLARELLLFLDEYQSYSAERWLERMISFLTVPGNHSDTYVEEFLRYFFLEYAKGEEPLHCGRMDENHIGGYSLMLPLLLVFSESPAYARKLSLDHLALTHGGKIMNEWGDVIAQLILAILQGESLSTAIDRVEQGGQVIKGLKNLVSLRDLPDTVVVGKHFSSACYVDSAVPATLYLALKYHDKAAEALIANTMCGGDNCGRGALLGALLGAMHGAVWPRKWTEGLLDQPPIFQLGPG